MTVTQDQKSSFVLYCEYREHIEMLCNEERGELFTALLDYADSGEEPHLSGAVRMAFSFIRKQMDRDAAKYAETCRKRSESGKKGGRPPKSAGVPETGKKPDMGAAENPENQEKAKKANGFTEKQSEAKKADNEYEYEYVYEYENGNGITPPNPPSGGNGSDSQEQHFAEFWSAYPKKVSKKAALMAWKRLNPDKELFERIMRAVIIAKGSEQWSRENGRYIPNPSAWINQERWDDELLPDEIKPLAEQSKKQDGPSNPFLALLEGRDD